METLIREGFKLNPDKKAVESIMKAIERNHGKCPCIHPDNDGDLMCPCDSYRLRDICYCHLYIKENE